METGAMKYEERIVFALRELYRRFGFCTKVKDCHYDPCGMDENNQPVYEEKAWWLLSKEL